jgi:hypothetical protein
MKIYVVRIDGSTQLAIPEAEGFEKQEIVPAVEPNPWTLLQLAYLFYLTGERNFP